MEHGLETGPGGQRRGMAGPLPGKTAGGQVFRRALYRRAFPPACAWLQCVQLRFHCRSGSTVCGGAKGDSDLGGLKFESNNTAKTATPYGFRSKARLGISRSPLAAKK